ncbi:MAG: hypothetical protein ACAH59_06505 [Pseudobdellovibrionaceae bacterium]
MRSFPSQWWTPRKALFLYFAVAVIAVALTACNKKKEDSPKKDPPKQQVPLNVTQNQAIAQSFLKMGMANSAEIKDIVNRAGNNLGSLTLEAYATFGISTLSANGQLSGQDSLLVITLTVRSAQGSGTVNIETRDSQLYYTTAGAKVEGYWTIPQSQSGSEYPAYIGINAVISQVNGADIYNQYLLKGQLISNVDLDATYEILSDFNKPVCSLIRDASFLQTTQGPLDCGNND